MSEHILITGGSGFVGGHLIDSLKTINIRFTLWQRSQLSNPIMLIPDDITTIIHLAGKAHDLKNVAEPDAYDKINFQLTKTLYDAYLISNATKFIFVSSIKAVADSYPEIIDENVIPNPRTAYGISKLKAEQYIQSHPTSAEKLYYILRPCMIHGPKNKGNLNLLYNFVKKGLPYPLAAFANKRSFLSIQNLCFIILEVVLQSSIEYGIYHLSDDQPLSTNEVVSILANSMDKKPRLWYLPKELIKMIAKWGDLIKIPLNTERLDKLTESYVVSNVKILNAMKKHLPVSTTDGLKLTAKSFQK